MNSIFDISIFQIFEGFFEASDIIAQLANAGVAHATEKPPDPASLVAVVDVQFAVGLFAFVFSAYFAGVILCFGDGFVFVWGEVVAASQVTFAPAVAVADVIFPLILPPPFGIGFAAALAA